MRHAARLSAARGARSSELDLDFVLTRQTGLLSHMTYATFLSTNAEFFDPNAMQLHTACSMAFFLPTSGT